jgi:hypothetical protein
VALTQPRGARLLRSRGEGERTACAAITRRERQTACAATRRGHQAGIGISPTSFGTL